MIVFFEERPKLHRVPSLINDQQLSRLQMILTDNSSCPNWLLTNESLAQLGAPFTLLGRPVGSGGWARAVTLDLFVLT